MHAHDHPRAGNLDEAIERYGKHAGSDKVGIAWAQIQARNGLRAGMHESEALLAAFNELDLWMQLAQAHCPNVIGNADQFVRDAGMEA